MTSRPPVRSGHMPGTARCERPASSQAEAGWKSPQAERADRRYRDLEVELGPDVDLTSSPGTKMCHIVWPEPREVSMIGSRYGSGPATVGIAVTPTFNGSAPW